MPSHERITVIVSKIHRDHLHSKMKIFTESEGPRSNLSIVTIRTSFDPQCIFIYHLFEGHCDLYLLKINRDHLNSEMNICTQCEEPVNSVSNYHLDKFWSVYQ